MLSDWTVTTGACDEYRGRSTVLPAVREAHVRPWYDGEDEPDDYAQHEVLHIAFAAAKAGNKETEELFVQDLCQVISPYDSVAAMERVES